VGLAAFALINIVTGVWSAIDPRSFYDAVGPFAPYNSHYIRDAASAMQGSLGLAMAIAVVRRSWRVGVLGYAAIQFTFHSINHLVDIGDADPKSTGVVDFVTLGISAATLAWLLTRALREERAA
jgi:hypothetical protein